MSASEICSATPTDGSTDDLVATISNATYELQARSNHKYRFVIGALIHQLARELNEEMEDMELDPLDVAQWKDLLDHL